MDIIGNIEADLGLGGSTPAPDAPAPDISVATDIAAPDVAPEAPAAAPVDPRIVAAVGAVAPTVDADVWAAALAVPMATYAIAATDNRLAAFMGQVAEETGGFTVMQENLHYQAARLCAVWPGRFPSLTDAEPYAMNPEKLANKVYAGRLGNGDEASGDGYRFRGMGLIQLTGRSLFTSFGRTVGKSAEDAAAWCLTPEGAAASACWYWATRKLNPYADAWEITEITKLVNGGLTNLDTRLRLSNAALAAIKAAAPVA
jgi:predicted chitinase